MADPDFSTRDRPPSGNPGEHLGPSLRTFWIGVLVILVMCVVVIVAVG
ncbi:hypothetical protein [Streptacidiphilus melanogenes]|nr:hypothetical protein [Streptacidiphilus melanogenes]